MLRNLEQSKEAELVDMRNKLQTIKTEDEAKMNREREDAKIKFDDLKNKYVILCRNFCFRKTCLAMLRVMIL